MDDYTKAFLDKCSQNNASAKSPSQTDYTDPTISALDVDQVIAHGGCSPQPCTTSSTGVYIASGLAGVA